MEFIWKVIIELSLTFGIVIYKYTLRYVDSFFFSLLILLNEICHVFEKKK